MLRYADVSLEFIAEFRFVCFKPLELELSGNLGSIV